MQWMSSSVGIWVLSSKGLPFYRGEISKHKPICFHPDSSPLLIPYILTILRKSPVPPFITQSLPEAGLGRPDITSWVLACSPGNRPLCVDLCGWTQSLCTLCPLHLTLLWPPMAGGTTSSLTTHHQVRYLGIHRKNNIISMYGASTKVTTFIYMISCLPSHK